MTKAERQIIEKAIDEIKEKEMDCYREIGFLNEHKFEMEIQAMRYKIDGYTNSWLIISSALDKLTKQ